jgi:hypothetical protein
MKSSPAGLGGSLKSKPTWSNPAGNSASSAFLFHVEGDRSIVISLILFLSVRNVLRN